MSALQELVNVTQDVFLARYTIMATVACLVYDYILTFKEEKRLVWTSHVTIAKIAFFLNRYLPFVATIGMMHTLLLVAPENIVIETCKPRFMVFGSFVLAEYLVAAFILYLRAHAIWGCKRSMLIVLTTVFVVITVLGAYFTVRFVTSVSELPMELFRTGCLLTFSRSKDCKIAIIILVISETFALSVVLVKAVQMPNSRIMRIISSDGIVYFILIICASIVNLVVLSVTPTEICNFLIATQSALQSICCNHLLLRIRGSVNSLVITQPSKMASALGGQLPLDDIEITPAGSWNSSRHSESMPS